VFHAGGFGSSSAWTFSSTSQAPSIRFQRIPLSGNAPVTIALITALTWGNRASRAGL
jgi:hypothetical protein